MSGTTTGAKVWISADLHLGHANIIRYCNRPFRSVQEMDDTIIGRINEKVQPHDALFIIGDFAFSRNKDHWVETWKEYRSRIACRHMVLVTGNHDPHYKNYEPKKEIGLIFAQVATTYMMRVPCTETNCTAMPWEDSANPLGPFDYRQIYLHHYACRVWPHSHHGSWHLYGHSHGMLPEDPRSLSFDVGVDCWDFYPMDMNQIAAKMANKLWTPPFARVSED